METLWQGLRESTLPRLQDRHR